MRTKMLLNDTVDLQLSIGAVMKIRHGSTNEDYIKSSQETAREVLKDSDGRPVEETPVRAMQVVDDLTR